MRLHWLLPDWSWEIESDESHHFFWVKARSPLGWINLQIGIESATKDVNNFQEPIIQLVRAGELVYGEGAPSPVSGWVSPTYGYKIPALSLAVGIDSPLPVDIRLTRGRQ